MTEQGTEGREHPLVESIRAAAKLVSAIEPARGKIETAQLAGVRTALEPITAACARRDELAALGRDAANQLEAGASLVYARAAAIAIAAGNEVDAERWLAAAEGLSHDDESRAELAAARTSHERYRALIHGRVLMARGEESAARARWTELARHAHERDAIARAAAEELAAPRPLRSRDDLPSLWRLNGCGVGFYGRSRPWADRSYATLHCLSLLWIPVLPLGAWRVRDEHGGYQILARERLPRWARRVRWGLPAAIALAIAAIVTVGYLGDPDRLAAQRMDAAIEAAHDHDAEAALHRLDDELQRDIAHVDAGRAERAGTEVVRLAAGRVASPFTVAALDQATRLIGRYRGLPAAAQGGAARDAMLAALDRWIHALGDTGATAEARLTLLVAARDIAGGRRTADIAAQITAARLALAASRQADWPLDALAILVDRSTGADGDADRRTRIAAADAVVARLADSPSLLVDAGDDLDAWAAATGDGAARTKIAELRKTAQAGRAEAEAEGVAPAQLADMAAHRPWDQFVALQLARGEASAGKLDLAMARLTRLGPPGATIRAARFLLAQLTAAQGKLEAADAMLAALLSGRLTRFTAASRALNEAGQRAQDRVQQVLKTGVVPDDLRRRVEAAASDADRNALVRTWAEGEITGDKAVAAAREQYLALTDVVPMALEAGSVKLRRAQAMSAAARTAMLQDAERTFLAIRSEAEGQPSFRLALGEIYARLGKTAESDTELGAVLARRDPGLSLQVAAVYRGLGSTARAKQSARDVFGSASSPLKEQAAHLLAVMSRDDEAEAEAWYHKSDQRQPQVQASLLEIEGARLERQGKATECEAKFAAAAKLHLGTATASDTTGFNNAAVAYEHGFNCSGDPQALRDAEAALDRAYRSDPEEPIVAGNLLSVLSVNGNLRVLARHVNVRALRLGIEDASEVVAELLEGPERAALAAELAADPSLRRSHELVTQLEILAPNNPRVYELRFADAKLGNDVAAAAAVVARARQAKGLDASSTTAARERWRSGADDAMRFAALDATRARLEGVLGGAGAARLDPKTRAAGEFVLARARGVLGLYRNDPALLARSREAAATSPWPALDATWLITNALIDEAGLAAGPEAWIAMRRLRSTTSALDKLIAAHDPLAAKIRGSASWAAVAGHAAADRTVPTIGALRLARMLGDAALEARARAVLDDKLAHLGQELAVVLDPSDEVARADLAYLDAR